MILVPKLFNVFSKDRPSWQQWYDRRLRLLLFAGPAFWGEDLELIAAGAPYAMTGIMQNGGVLNSQRDIGVLTLNALTASDTDASFASSNIQFRANGNVYENGVAQNSSVEWTDNSDSDVGADCEVNCDHTGGTAPVYSAGWSDNTYIDISASRTISMTRVVSGTTSGFGTAYVRETRAPNNEVSAAWSLFATVSGGGQMIIP